MNQLLSYAERMAPRYTSYPTTPHFSADIGASTHNLWLGALPKQALLSLYIHVPYCHRLCWYCGCNAYAFCRPEVVETYVSDLLKEIELSAKAASSHSVDEIHWGGGTPNSLSPEQILRIMTGLRENFALSPLANHAVEMDPRTLSDEHISTYRAAGVNRASLGVQDLTAHVQAAMGRIQPIEIVDSAVARLRAGEISHISFDLMYGLPDQTTNDILSTAQLACQLEPDRVSIFGYAHVPWFRKRQRLIDESKLPGPAERLEQAGAAREALLAHGYVSIGIDHFAKPHDQLARAAAAGLLRRNFQGYVIGSADAIVGLGPSSISTFPQGFTQNQASVSAWRTALSKATFASCRGHALNDDDRLRGELISSIMCTFSAILPETFDAEREALKQMARDNLVAFDGRSVRVLDHAKPYTRLVAQVLDAYAATAARHSLAV